MSSTDLRALGRLGKASTSSGGGRRRGLATRRVRGAPAATRRPRVPRSAGLVLACLIAALGYVGVSALSQADAGSVIATIPAIPAVDGDGVGDEPRRATAVRADRAERGGPNGPPLDASASAAALPFASVDGLELGLPHDGAALVAFHEASLPEALGLTPVGRVERNDNPTKFAGGRDTAEPGYHVLSSRGRPRPATSAADIVVPKGATVVAPVSGTVVESRDYALYGATRDWRVVIEPDERPDLHVVMIHLHRPAVRVGEEVTAGETPLAVARQLSFTSQVDYVVGDHLPHVHLEVKAATSPRPVDPNASAVPPDEAADAEPSG